ncbi:uncharacterized protein [Blastocystis hominis]|uniref:Uncharacterized protein n=1 Tax=Blastocystis hominis TaxID=12968 RepID=D8LVU0_BLAHO|nr:uncharacterized protein [Blastocystis hominis]CBK19929.2 unnamed protein product [Blastocystis hominis]|eukprot:XP_012893977.1 uncharacterized protein [Blastocystis hominis]
MPGFYEERDMDDHLMSYSQMNRDHLRHGLCYLYYRKKVNGEEEEDVIQSIREFRDGKDIITRRAFLQDKMTVYDDNGNVIYEGGFENDPTKGYGRSGQGTEYYVDGNKDLLYKGDFANDKFHGKGRIFVNGYVYSEGHYKNGMLHGSCLIKKKGETKRIRYYYHNHNIICFLFCLLILILAICACIGFLVDVFFFRTVRIKTVDDLLNLSPRTLFLIAKPNCCTSYGSNEFIVTDHSQLRLIRIDANNFQNVTYFEVGAIPSLERLAIGDMSFGMDSQPQSVIPNDLSFSVFNCSSLQSITIGKNSFVGFLQFDISSLPSLQSIYIGDTTQQSNNFMNAPLKLFDLPNLITLDLGMYSFMNAPAVEIDNLAALDSISLGLKSCMGDASESSLVLRDLPSLKTLTSSGYSFMNQQHIVLMNIPNLTKVSLPSAFSNRESVETEM